MKEGDRMDAQNFVTRRKLLESQLPEQSLTFLFAGVPKQKTLDMDYPFCVNRNFYYMTGFDKPNQFLMIEKIDGAVREWLFIDRPDPYLERYTGKMIDKEEAAQRSGVTCAEYIDRFDWHIGRLLSRNCFEHVLFDFHKRELDSVRYPENDMCERITHAYPNLKVGTVSALINNQRRIKDEQELACMRRAIDITQKGIEAIMDHLRDGVNEAELQAHFDFALTMNGAKDTAFDSIIAGGANSNVLHYANNDQTVHNGDVVLLDLGAEYGYYAADISRTLPVSGRFTPVQKTVYNAVLYGQEKVFEFLAPGKPVEDTLRIAREAIGEKLLEAGLIKDPSEMERVLPHGVSHYVGLDCHDVGERGLLMPGMVVTMEPGAYLPELGFGVRIEDDVLITKDGAQLLSAQIPKTVEQIEAYLAGRKRS